MPLCRCVTLQDKVWAPTSYLTSDLFTWTDMPAPPEGEAVKADPLNEAQQKDAVAKIWAT